MEKVNKLYVGNLSFNSTEEGLKKLFEDMSIQPKSVAIIKDKYTGKSKGFGFVEVGTSEEMQKAIDSLNGKDVDGRPLTVNEARPMKERSGDSGFGPRRNSRY